jgi:ADP-heptose:LPS heptosyltransferase
MRTSRRFNTREIFSAVFRFLFSKVSFGYFRFISKNEITLIRDGGLGDAIMSTAVIDIFSQRYPKTRINLITPFPEVFEGLDVHILRKPRMPYVWLTYGHSDVPLLRPFFQKHCRESMGEMVAIDRMAQLNYVIPSYSNLESLVHLGLHKKKYIVIQTEAGEWFKEKNWKHENWEMICENLKSDGWDVYQIGTLANARVKGSFDLRGMLNLKECFTLIKFASFLIGVNSFAEQVAAAFGVRSLVLYGPTNPFYSLNKNQWAISGAKVIPYEKVTANDYDFQPTEDISFELVFGTFQKLILN